MKNLFVTAAMLVFFGSSYAQDTPTKTKKQSTTTTDTIIKSKSGSNNSNNSTYKTDTITKHRTDKKTNKTRSTTDPVNNSRKDSVKSAPTTP